MAPVFSDAWAKAWAAALNDSPAYRVAAATWEGSVLARLPAEPVDGVFLDLWHGECRAARRATTNDAATADFVLEADGPAWQLLLNGRVAPVMALLTGKVRVARGELAQLLPYANAAKELIALAATIQTEYPADWNPASPV